MGSIYTTLRKYPNAENQNKQQPNSPFDRLPDDVIRIIINKIHDARILIRILTLNKRFASIVAQTDAVSFPLYICPRPRQNNSNNSNGNGNGNGNNNTNLTRVNPMNILRSVLDYIITKFLRSNNQRDNQRRRRRRAGSGCLMTAALCQSPPQILRTFRNISDLHLELHTYGGAVDNVFLKWKASFDGELKTCVVICATSFRRFVIDESQRGESDLEDGGTPPPPPSVPNDEFKLRIMWSISCLIAASARHFLLKQVLVQFPAVKTAKITDTRRQGNLCMVEDEIQELRESLKEEGALELSVERVVPDLRMRMWYVPVLDLAETRSEMKGATLLVIGPANSKGELVPPPEMYGVDGGYDGDPAEKEVFAEAEREIVNIKKRTSYVMEMTSF